MVLLVLFALIMNDPSADDRAAFEKATSEYDAGRYDVAATHFSILSTQPGPLAPLANYAVGNSCIRQALREGLSEKERNSRLLQAVAAYRAALDLAPGTPLDRDDTKHNLELAKRLLILTPKIEEQTQRPLPPRSTGKQSQENQTGEPLRDQNLAVRASDKVDEKSTGESSNVTKSKGGIAPLDPGPLAISDAENRLAKAMERIKREQDSRLKIRSTDPRRGKGDY